MLLAWPATAQVEIRGLTIAPADRPGNGGIMLKSLLSTRLPGEISEIAGSGAGVLARIDGKNHRLTMRNGELVNEPGGIPPTSSTIQMIYGVSVDLDGDGSKEIAQIEVDPARLTVKRDSQELASVPGNFWRGVLEYVDVTRSGKPQILAVGEKDNCVKVFSFAGNTLTELGSLSCGAPLVGTPVRADIDNDGRYDLIVARQPDRIEIFLR
jgi:hypothetical protein